MADSLQERLAKIRNPSWSYKTDPDLPDLLEIMSDWERGVWDHGGPYFGDHKKREEFLAKIERRWRRLQAAHATEVAETREVIQQPEPDSGKAKPESSEPPPERFLTLGRNARGEIEIQPYPTPESAEERALRIRAELLEREEKLQSRRDSEARQRELRAISKRLGFTPIDESPARSNSTKVPTSSSMSKSKRRVKASTYIEGFVGVVMAIIGAQIPELFPSILLLIFGCLFMIHVIWKLKLFHKSKFSKLKNGAVVCGTLALLCLIWWATRPVKAIDQPEIAASLVIDSISGRTTYFSFKIENGDVPVKIKRIISQNERMYNLQNESEISVRDIPKRRSLVITAAPGIDVFRPYEHNSLNLEVLYTAKVNDAIKLFVLRCRYFIQPGTLRPRTVEPDSCDRQP